MKEQILEATNNGLDVFAFYCAEMGFDKNNLKKPFKWRATERSPSTYIKLFQSGQYIISDFGGETGLNIFDFVIKEFSLTYLEACRKIIKDLALQVSETTKNNQATRLKISETPISDKLVEWFKNERNISLYTLLRFQVSESKQKLFIKKKDEYQERNCIAFPYFKNNELVNIKYRDAEKNFKLTAGAELVFFGLDFIAGQKECLITEGELDAMSYYEAGYFSVCSVPNGATEGNQNLKYLDNCWQYFEDKETIYLATDNDKNGNALAEELARRLGKHRCKRITQPLEYKDANDLWRKETNAKELIWEGINEAKAFPIKGIKAEEDLRAELRKLFEEGYPTVLRLGYPNFDRQFGFRTDIGEVTMMTGTPNSGKTTFLSQMIVRMVALHKWKIASFSPENQPESIASAKMVTQYIGKPFHKNSPNRINETEYKIGEDFVAKNIFFITADEASMTAEYIILKATELVKQKGINLLVVDPWNMIEHTKPENLNEHEYIGQTITKFTIFARHYKCHVIIVAHPTKLKTRADGNYEIPTMYNISGSSNFFNKPDNGLCVARDKTNGLVDVYVQKIRFAEFVGELGFSSFDFDKETSRYKEDSQMDFDTLATELTGVGNPFFKFQNNLEFDEAVPF